MNIDKKIIDRIYFMKKKLKFKLLTHLSFTTALPPNPLKGALNPTHYELPLLTLTFFTPKPPKGGFKNSMI